MITASTARLSPVLGVELGDVASRSARSTFSIFIASTMRERLAGLDLLALVDRDRLDEAGHRAEQRLPVSAATFSGISAASSASRRGVAPAPRPRRRAWEQRQPLRIGRTCTAIGGAVDRAVPDRLARPPVRMTVSDLCPSPKRRSTPIASRPRRRPRGARAPSATTRSRSKRHGSAVAQLARRCRACARFILWSIAAATAASRRAVSPSGAAALKAVREFLGDEAGRKPPLAPALMRHQGGEERDVVADAVDGEGVERRAPARRSPRARVGAWVTSLAIIGS